MQTLTVAHIPDTDPPRFEVIRQRDSKRAAPVTVAPATGFPVEGRPNSDLVAELAWYLEDFLGYPFSPETEHAERVQAALKKWGTQAFASLFGSGQARDWYHDAIRPGLGNLHVQISSDDPTVLAWPWEALEDPEIGTLAHGGRIDRKLNTIADVPEIAEELPTDRVNILLVTARPYKEKDVQYRSVSRPLVELIDKQKLPAHVTVLRPPTFGRLREHLRERPGFYHIVHFDGHGGYGEASGNGHADTQHQMQGPVGQLVFEDDSGKPDPIAAGDLSKLLREFRIPAVVLNACRSGMLDEQAEDPFASVAASLLKAGIRSVVAMAYSLYVSGAQEFLPAFYRRLFESGDVAEAVRDGRSQMLAQKKRVCARGKYPLDDWLVPVLYRQETFDFSFAAGGVGPAESRRELPQEARDSENPYGFVGRDAPLLALERAMLRETPAILIHGLGGVGKTTLARGFVEWLNATDGIGNGCFWLRFDESVRSADFVINSMGVPLFGAEFAAAGIDQRIEALAGAFKQHRFIIVWDNFETVCGIEQTHIKGTLSAEDRQHLVTFLRKLRGGASKVIITSRSDEQWLGEERRKIDIGGLEGEERWEYCERILGNLGVEFDRKDPRILELMDLLAGHPLAMRAILPRLESKTAAELIEAIRNNFAALAGSNDEATAKLFATLRFVEQSVAAEERGLLIPLALHERFADADYLGYMAKQVDGAWTRERIEGLLASLGVAGVVWARGQGIWELHPALTGYLRSNCMGQVASETREAWTRAFVDVMGGFADVLAPKELHEQRMGFFVHSANFHTALAEATRLGMQTDMFALTQSLAAFAENTRDFTSAHDFYLRLGEAARTAANIEVEAAAYHQIGMVAQKRRDLAGAEQWYLKSLAIEEKHGNEQGAAGTYHQLGMVAQERRDFTAAEQWCLKSLEISEKHGNERRAALTHHQLGMVAQERRDFAAAQQWYLKSLAIKEKLGDEHDAASTYHQLGIVAHERRDFTAAERWYLKSLAIKEKLGNEHGAASTYHQLGTVAQERRDFAAAEQWYLKSLVIKEKLGNEHGATSTYHQLGTVAQEQRDYVAAEQWYLKSLAISEKLGDEHRAASTYGQLGIIAGLQDRYEESGRWLIKGLRAFSNCNDQQGAQRQVSNFIVFYLRSKGADRAKLERMWREAGMGPLPEDESAGGADTKK